MKAKSSTQRRIAIADSIAAVETLKPIDWRNVPRVKGLPGMSGKNARQLCNKFFSQSSFKSNEERLEWETRACAILTLIRRFSEPYI